MHFQVGEERQLPARGESQPEGSGEGQAELRPRGAGPRGDVSHGHRGAPGTDHQLPRLHTHHTVATLCNPVGHSAEIGLCIKQTQNLFLFVCFLLLCVESFLKKKKKSILKVHCTP